MQEGSQLVIATHSPIVMALPGALIYVLSDRGPQRATWDELEHVKVLREFLERKDHVMAELLSDEP